MTAHRCETRCGRPAPGTAICPDCARRLKRDLKAAPGLIVELETTLSRQTAMGRAEGGRSADKPLPYNVAASTALDDLRRAYRYAGIQGADVGQVYEVVTRAVEQARRVIDRPPERRYAGTCGNDEDDREPCPEQLYGDPTERWVKCPRCQRNWDVEARRQVLSAVARDRVVNGATLSAALTQMDQPVPASTIRSWVRRGQLVRVGYDPDGRPMYLVGDALDLIAANEARAMGAFSNGAAS